MKKLLAITVVIAVVLVCLWYLLKVTYLFAVYKVPTDANKPAIKPGDVIYASRFADPGLNNFLCFQKPGVPLSIFRCIGLPNDVIEIRTGIVYRNGKPVDEPGVWNEYLINKATLNSIIGYLTLNGHDLYTVNDSTASVAISKNDLRELKLNLQRRVTAKDSVNEMISKAYPGTHYNEDNFGPVKIPTDSYFVLGDDRHNAADSRYIGFINKDEIKATVINK